jgi:hypothetical protein
VGPTNAYQKNDVRRRFVRLWLVASAFLAMNPREADNLTSGRLLDPDEARRRLESRLGPLHARLRLGIEREHEAQAFGQGLNFLHLENLPLMQAMIEIGLRATGTYWRGRANAGKVQLRRNTVSLPNLPTAFSGFTILHLSDLHADLSGPAMQRAAELACDLDYDLCVLTGDYRGRTQAIASPASKSWRTCVKHFAATSMECSATTTRLPWFLTSKRLVFACCSTSVSPYAPAQLRSISRGWTMRISIAQTTSKKRRRIFHIAVSPSCFRTLRKFIGRPPTPVLT